MIVPGDEEIEALLGNRTVKAPKLRCPSGHLIQRFCSRKQCQQEALCCSEDSCKNCESRHEVCILGELKRLTKQVEKGLHLTNKVIRDCLRIENDLINQIIASRRNLIEKLSVWKLEEKVSNTIDQIYFKANPKGLKGKDLKTLYQQLSSNNNETIFQDYVQYFKKEGEDIVRDFITLRENLFEFVITKNQAIDSTILNEDLQGKGKIEYLLKELKYPESLNLIFRASQHGFEASKFHQYCDNIPNTLTIVRTQFNRIIAAFTPLRWSSVDGHASDPYRSSFLLQLDIKQKMTLIKGHEQTAIYNTSAWGPTFGSSGLDLHICNKCYQEGLSGANFPNSYNYGNKYENNQESYTMISGNKNGDKFRVLEYEVFQVIK